MLLNFQSPGSAYQWKVSVAHNHIPSSLGINPKAYLPSSIHGDRRLKMHIYFQRIWKILRKTFKWSCIPVSNISSSISIETEAQRNRNQSLTWSSFKTYTGLNLFTVKFNLLKPNQFVQAIPITNYCRC